MNWPQVLNCPRNEGNFNLRSILSNCPENHVISRLLHTWISLFCTPNQSNSLPIPFPLPDLLSRININWFQRGSIWISNSVESGQKSRTKSMICILNRRQSISLLYNSKWLDLVLTVSQWLHILSTIASGQLRSTLDN